MSALLKRLQKLPEQTRARLQKIKRYLFRDLPYFKEAQQLALLLQQPAAVVAV